MFTVLSVLATKTICEIPIFTFEILYHILHAPNHVISHEKLMFSHVISYISHMNITFLLGSGIISSSACIFLDSPTRYQEFGGNEFGSFHNLHIILAVCAA